MNKEMLWHMGKMYLIAVLLIILADFSLYHAIPLGVEVSNTIDFDKYQAVGITLSKQVAYIKYPMFSIALHEKLHTLGFGEEIAYPITILQFLAYNLIIFVAVLKIDEFLEELKYENPVLRR